MRHSLSTATAISLLAALLACSGVKPPSWSDSPPTFLIPAGQLDPDVAAFVYADQTMRAGEAIPLAVRLQSRADELLLQHDAAPVAARPLRVGGAPDGSGWALFVVPSTAGAAMTLYADGTPHPFRASPLMLSADIGIWHLPDGFAKHCTPGATLAHRVTLEVETPATPIGWTGEASWTLALRCPPVSETFESGTNTLFDWVLAEEVGVPSAALTPCVRHELLVAFRTGRSLYKSRWDWTFLGNRRLSGRGWCDEALHSVLDSGAGEVPLSVRLRHDTPLVSALPAELPVTLPLVRPPPEAPVPRIPWAKLTSHLDEPALELDEIPDLGSPWAKPPGEWRPCKPDETSAATAVLGEIASCEAIDGHEASLLDVAYGSPQDCPAGCFFERAKGVVSKGKFRRLPEAGERAVSMAAQHQLAAWFEPPAAHNTRFWCDQGTLQVVLEPRTSGAIAHLDAQDAHCWLLRTSKAWAVGDGRTQIDVGLLAEIDLDGSAPLQPDGGWGWDGITMHTKRVLHVWIEPPAATEPGRGLRWEVVADHRSEGSAEPMCAVAPMLPPVNTLDETCGRMFAHKLLGGVLRADGALESRELHVGPQATPEWRSCASAAAAQIAAPPTKCPSTPVLQAY